MRCRVQRAALYHFLLFSVRVFFPQKHRAAVRTGLVPVRIYFSDLRHTVGKVRPSNMGGRKCPPRAHPAAIGPLHAPGEKEPCPGTLARPPLVPPLCQGAAQPLLPIRAHKIHRLPSGTATTPLRRCTERSTIIPISAPPSNHSTSPQVGSTFPCPHSALLPPPHSTTSGPGGNRAP